MSFPLGIMDKDWYNLSIKESNIARLNIESCNISKIREGAFNTTLLSFLTSLRLVDLPITFFEDGTFIGLESLKILWLEKLKITSLSPMLFDSLHSLKHFIVADCNPQRMDVSNMTGREKRPHKKLQSIVFNNNNLGDTIGENTFLGILQLETINLDNNRIESIGPGVLNALPPSLKKLILSNNKLKVLPSGLANLLKTSSKIRIFLRNNPWKCDCNLQFLLYAMTTNHQNFDGKVVKCASPLKYAGKVLISIPYLCSSIDSDESGPVASQIHSNSIVSPTKTSADLSSEQLDISYPDVSIEKPQRNIRVEQSLNGEHSLFISEFPFDHYILGFENNEIIVEDSKFRQSSCIANDLALQTKNVRISLELKSDRVYKFCVMKKGSMETSPFNCVSLYTNPTKQENLSSFLRCRIAVTALWIIVAVIFLTFVIIKNFSTSSRRPAIKEKEENTNGSDSPAKEMYV